MWWCSKQALCYSEEMKISNQHELKPTSLHSPIKSINQYKLTFDLLQLWVRKDWLQVLGKMAQNVHLLPHTAGKMWIGKTFTEMKIWKTRHTTEDTAVTSFPLADELWNIYQWKISLQYCFLWWWVFEEKFKIHEKRWIKQMIVH